MSVKWKKRIFSDLLLVVSGIVVVFVIPEFVSVPTGCLFNKATGFYCAGCGISRCVHALLKGKLQIAMHQNLLFITVFPLSILWLTIRFYILKIPENLNKYDKAVIILLIIIVLSFTVLRNIPAQCFQFLRPV